MKVEMEIKTEKEAEELLLEFVKGVDEGLTRELKKMGVGRPDVLLLKSGEKYYLRVDIKGLPDLPSYAKRVVFRGLMKRLCGLVKEALERGGYRCEVRAVW